MNVHPEGDGSEKMKALGDYEGEGSKKGVSH
jgi:hypothetical protein